MELIIGLLIALIVAATILGLATAFVHQHRRHRLLRRDARALERERDELRDLLFGGERAPSASQGGDCGANRSVP